MPANEELSNQLRALGFKLGKDIIHEKDQKKTISSENTVFSIMDGDWSFVGEDGNTFIRKKSYPLPYQHGEHILGQDIDSRLVFSHTKSKLQQKSKFPEIPKILYLDIETTGLLHSTSTIPFMVGLGYNTENNFIVKQYFMNEISSEEDLLTDLSEFCRNYNILITYNGKSFDIPVLAQRYRFYGITNPFKEIIHIDFLHFTRQLWKYRYESKKLSDLEVSHLHLARSDDEIPGYLIPDIYYSYLQDRHCGLIKKVFYHNEMDIISLAALFESGSKMMSHPAADYHNGEDAIAVSKFYQDIGENETVKGLYRIGIDSGLPEPLLIKTLYNYAKLLIKDDNWEDAKPLFLRAAQLNHYHSMLDLAKYYEHKLNDIDQAIVWVEHASNTFGEHHDNLHKRYERLLRKRNSTIPTTPPAPDQ